MLVVILILVFVASITLGLRNQTKYRKHKINEKAEAMGYEKIFDDIE